MNACGTCGGDLFFTPGEAPCICTPSLPYDGGTSSGWSGTATSRDRATERDESGKTAKVQATVLRLANEHGRDGITVAELRSQRGVGHHGTASQALSTLEKDGRLTMLAERRGRCHVYVLPRYAEGRDLAPARHRRADLTVEEGRLYRRLNDMVAMAEERSEAGQYPTVNLTLDTLRALATLIGRLSDQ